MASWLAFTLWLVIDVAVWLLWRSAREQVARERADRNQLDELAGRFDDIERYVFRDNRREDDDQWQDPASDR